MAPNTAHRLPVVLLARVVMLGLGVGLTWLSDPAVEAWFSVGAVAIVALAASAPWPDRVAWAVPYAEAALAAAAIAGADPVNPALLPYLVVPALAAGLTRGARGAVINVLASGLVLIAAGGTSLVDASNNEGIGGDAVQWLVTALALGLVAAWAGRLQDEPVDADLAAYEAAYRLLGQLRAVSRQLSAGLDPLTLGSSMLDDLLTALPADRGAVYTVSEGRLVPLTSLGIRPDTWLPRTSDGSAWARALHTRSAQVAPAGLGLVPTPDMAAAVVPVAIGDRVVAVVGLERSTGAFEPQDLEVATSWAGDYAIRLDTALLFADIRDTATTEERRRLAREIHDGVAQELTSMGYVIDDLAADASSPRIKAGLQELRSEITRVITELRLSIFDLRSEVAPGVSLGTALADYVRSIGPSMAAEFHVRTDETTERLRFETEAELLRIAQEAITNVRRHSDARNVWVTSSVNPPSFSLSIADDGQGLGQRRPDSYGMEIMRERAQRIGAVLTIKERPGGGTVVEVAAQSTDRAAIPGRMAPQGPPVPTGGHGGTKGES